MTLSGGNKRKLSLAISMMGSPPLIFLDEPSTGVDPAARRLMWNVISVATTMRQESTVMLTTHNMVEAEALCSRIGIMVGGRLRCIGSNQHLKARFSKGYQLEARLQCPAADTVATFLDAHSFPAKLDMQGVAALCQRLGAPDRAAWVQENCEQGHALYEALAHFGEVPIHLFGEWWLLEDRVEAMNQFFQERFLGTVALERHDRTLRYRLPATCALSEIFKCLERGKDTLFLEEYGISQTSLEQIFNEFASQQEEETGPVRGLFVSNSAHGTGVDGTSPSRTAFDVSPNTP